jgi:hypothetical protein
VFIEDGGGAFAAVADVPGARVPVEGAVSGFGAELHADNPNTASVARMMRMRFM